MSNTSENRGTRSSLKPAAGITIVLAMALAAGVVYTLFVHRGGAAGDEAVFGGWVYSADDQRIVSATLAKARFSEYRWENNRLYVPAARRARCEQLLSENQALPSSPSDVKRDAIEEISSFESESKTRMRDLYSSARQLEQTLSRFEPIESATVGVCTRRERGELAPKTVTTATIGIRTSDEGGLTPELVSSVTLAAKHQLGIASNEDISIMDMRSGCSFLGDDRAVGQCETIRLAEERRQAEERWRGKFQEALGPIPGLKVDPSIELTTSGAEALPENAPLESQRAPQDSAPNQTFTSEEAGCAPTLEGPRGDHLPSIASGGRAGTLVFRPNSIAEVPTALSPIRGTEPVSRMEKMTVVVAVPESYVRERGRGVLETIRRTAGELADSAVGRPENRSIQIKLYDDENSSGAENSADGENSADTQPARRAAESAEEAAPPAGWKIALRENISSLLKKAPPLWGRLKRYSALIAAGGAAALLLAVARIASSLRARRRGASPARSEAAERKRPQATSDSGLCEEVIDHVQSDPKRTAEILEQWIQTGA